MASSLARARAVFEQEFGCRPAQELHRFFVPGRIEVLGKHTDYAGGPSLLAATAQGVVVVSALNGRKEVRLANADSRFPKAAFPLTGDLEIPRGPWTNYPMTVTRRLLRDFGGDQVVQGVDVAFASDLPVASGMSSSTAMIVASYFAIAHPNGLTHCPEYRANIQTREDLAMYLACIENGSGFRGLGSDQGVGTFGGSEDHTAMLCCQAGCVSLYSFCPIRFERSVPFPDDLAFVVCHSGVQAEKTGAALEAYNAVAERAREACAAYNRHFQAQHQNLGDVVCDHAHLAPEALLAKFQQIPELAGSSGPLLDRFRQFFQETQELIPQAVDSLAREDLHAFGRLVDLSHDYSRQFLGNIIPEIDWLQRQARGLGALAASGFGAGFGGSVYALVRSEEAGAFQRVWKADYSKAFPRHQGAAAWLITRPAEAAHEIRP